MHDFKEKFSTFINSSLNAQQQEPVLPKNGIFLVCAGAGSGKTRVITARITNLMLAHDALPANIVALTFTNKAAQEMKDRLQSFLPHQSQLPYVGTFHSYCLRLLKVHAHRLGITDFT